MPRSPKAGEGAQEIQQMNATRLIQTAAQGEDLGKGLKKG